jgi:hypothetical protein
VRVVLMFMIAAHATIAQTATPSPLPTPVYVGERIQINSMYWLPESQILAFTGSGDYGWDHRLYDAGAQVLTELEQPHNTSVLTAAQQTQMDARSEMAFNAYDRRTVIYETREWYSPAYTAARRWAIGDIETGEYIYLDIGIGHSHAVFWNADSTVALIAYGGMYGGSGLVYIDNFAEDLRDVRIYHIGVFESGHNIFGDITPDGERVLLRERGLGDELETGLRLWDAATPERVGFDMPLFFEHERVTGAAFDSHDDDSFYAVLPDGIARYSISASTTEILNPTINANWIRWAYFSPDLTYIAVIPRNRSGFDCAVFVLPLDFSGDVEKMLDAVQCKFYG